MNAFERKFQWAAIVFASLPLLAGDIGNAADLRIENLEPAGEFKQEYDLMTDVIDLFDIDLLDGNFTSEKAERVFVLAERHPHQRGIVALAADAVNLAPKAESAQRLNRLIEIARKNPDATMINLSAAELILIKRKSFQEALPFLRAAYQTVREGREDDPNAAEAAAWKYLGCLSELRSPEFRELREELSQSPKFRCSVPIWNLILLSRLQEARKAEPVYPACALFPIPCPTTEARIELDRAVRHCLDNLLDREKDPQSVSFLDAFSLIHDELGRRRDVENAVLARLRRAPDDAEALFMLAVIQNVAQRHAEAAATCEKLLRVLKEPGETLLIFYGDALEKADRFKDAENVFRNLSLMNPDNSGHRCRLLATLVEQKRHREAIELAETLPDVPEVVYLHAYCLFCEKDAAGALARLKTLRGRKDVDWNSRPLVLLSAILAEKNGDFDFLESVLRPYLKKHPDDGELLNFIGYVFVDRDYKIEEGAEFIRRANEILPDHEEILDSMAWAEFKLKRYDEAKRWILKSIAKCQEPQRTILDHAGDIFSAAGDSKTAVDFWRKALDAKEDEDSPAASAIQDKIRAHQAK